MPKASGHNPEPSALEAAFGYLRSRDRFAAELRAHLATKGYEEDVVEKVVKFLVERKLVNDNKATQNLIERNSGKRAVGIERLKAELERLGAPEELIERHLESEADESRLALGALEAKYKTGTTRAKAGRFLYGRGFSEEAIESALDIFCGQEIFPE